VKIGHGPATVIGPPIRTVYGSQGKPRVRNAPEPIGASTLREKESGDQPRYPREAFLLEMKLGIAQGKERFFGPKSGPQNDGASFPAARMVCNNGGGPVYISRTTSGRYAILVARWRAAE
jgi:hypothetical protein